jgi:mRNA interferase MazF
MYNQSDIVVVRFPFTDGSEFKKRPVLIISNELVNKTGDVLIVQITSKVNNDGFSVAIEDVDIESPLPYKSYIRTHKIYTVHKELILNKITTAKPLFLQSIIDRIGVNIEIL